MTTNNIERDTDVSHICDLFPVSTSGDQFHDNSTPALFSLRNSTLCIVPKQSDNVKEFETNRISQSSSFSEIQMFTGGLP